MPSLRAIVRPMDSGCSLALRSMREGAAVDVSEFARRGQVAAARRKWAKTHQVILDARDAVLLRNPTVAPHAMASAIKTHLQLRDVQLSLPTIRTHLEKENESLPVSFHFHSSAS